MNTFQVLNFIYLYLLVIKYLFIYSFHLTKNSFSKNSGGLDTYSCSQKGSY